MNHTFFTIFYGVFVPESPTKNCSQEKQTKQSKRQRQRRRC